MMVILIFAIILLIIYLFLVAPRMVHRAERTAITAHKFYAHRGLFDNEGDAPENSLAAFRKAVEAGYGMEMDIQLTKDDKLVVFHDATLKECAAWKGMYGIIRWKNYSSSDWQILSRPYQLLKKC